MLSNRKILGLLALTLVLLSICNSRIAESKNLPIRPRVSIGPGVILGCKHIRLWSTRNANDNTWVDSKMPSFSKSQQWVMSNCYSFMNGPVALRNVPDPEFCLSMNLQNPMEGGSIRDLLITIPLDADSLGPQFRERILELRTIMNSKD